MRSATFATLLSLAASAIAYQVTFPTETQGWTNSGPQTLTWNRVDTDPLNFTALLTNENAAILPTKSESLAALVDGTKGTISLNPPSSGWPLGSGFRVNLVKDENDPNTILAQSPQFNITVPRSGASSGLPSGSNAPTASAPGGTTVIAPPPSPTAGSSGSSDTPAPAPTTNAAVHVAAQGGVVAALALFGFFLA